MQPERTLAIVVRSDAPTPAFVRGVRETVRDLDRALPVADLRTMDDVVSSALSRQRFNTLALGVFAVAALLLAGIGLYGVMSYLIAQRTREFGIRIALGERPQRVRTLVLGQSVSIAAAGLAAGLILSAVLSRAMKSLLYGIAPLDLPTYAAITAVLLTVAMLAAYAPARRATKIDPVAALRG